LAGAQRRMSAKVCLITPGHLSTNPRVVKEADALAGAGYDVTVIAATFQKWSREADEAFASRPWRAVEPVPFGPLAPRRRRVTQVARYAMARSLERAGASHLLVRCAAAHQAAPDLAAAAARVEADLYIAHYTAALPAAARAAQLNGAKYAFDAEDFHLGEASDGPAGQRERRRIAAIEKAYLPGCAYITAASPGIANGYAETFGLSKPCVILNVFPLSEAANSCTRAGAAEPGPSVYWFSQTIGPNRGLECAVLAIGRSASRPHLYLRGNVGEAFRSKLESLSEQAGARDRIHFAPPSAPGDMVRLASAFDAGLVAETGHSRNRQIALTNKQFTYMLAGLPSIMSDIPAHRDFAAKAGAAVRLYRTDDPASLAEAIDDIFSSPERLAHGRSAAFRLGQERYNWDVEQSKFLACVERALSRPR
jgi:glycosyltransferase involved in cell wall biosynthesis